MKYVTIPNSELRVSQICLGSAEFGATMAPKDSFALLDAFIAAGGNFIDTAHVYSDWIPNTKSTSEKLIGEWLRKSGMREDVLIATKGAHPRLTSMNVSRLSKDDIETDVHESLEYLQTETIDLYWLHRDDVSIPVGEIIEALNEQVWLGNIRYFGCSNWTFSRIQEAMDYELDIQPDSGSDGLCRYKKCHWICGESTALEFGGGGYEGDTRPNIGRDG
jgi:aryl-alcohol dehydrogenase-like predicted oxidoreductase